jgi:tRNA threonylcarbamoyladenosine modification (KEOPS) complex  Pcc1 subunit
MLDSKRTAQAVYAALKPETSCPIGARSSVRIRLVHRELQITVQAGDLNALRAALSSYLRWISSSGDVTSIIDQPNATRLSDS